MHVHAITKRQAIKAAEADEDSVGTKPSTSLHVYALS